VRRELERRLQAVETARAGAGTVEVWIEQSDGFLRGPRGEVITMNEFEASRSGTDRATAISWVDQQATDHRRSLRARIEWCDLIRKRFRVMGIDPALAVTLRRGEEAAAELAAIPDTPDLKAADEAMVRPECSDGDDGARRVRARIEQMAEQYRSGQHQLDLANASPAQLLAFCVAVEMEAWG
jgi:hypothetical protein